MAGYEFDWIDAFTDSPMGGNPCAVVHDAAHIPDAQRIAFVRETKLVECAYLVPSDAADFGARFYLADGEIPMAGHPTIATVVSLLDRGLVVPEGGQARFTLETGAGVMPIEVDSTGDIPVITMTQAAPEFGRTWDRAEIAAILGLEAGDVLDDPQTVSTGSPFCILPLKGLAALRRARLDVEMFERALARPECDFLMIFATVPEGVTPRGDTFSRLLIPPPSPPEDPFTGSATGCMAAYFRARGHIASARFTAEQGHWMDRPGSARVEVLGPPTRISGVKVGGSGVVVMRGTVEL